jgi:hypothetical protein
LQQQVNGQQLSTQHIVPPFSQKQVLLPPPHSLPQPPASSPQAGASLAHELDSQPQFDGAAFSSFFVSSSFFASSSLF